MGKIDEFVEKKKLLPRDLAYHTNRSIKPKGRIRVLVPKEDNLARVEYMCPECSGEGFVEQPWQRPFSVKCAKCGFKISVPKMKQQFKKEMKAEQAAKK
jgi:DNA-directed RNA polymerase subunit RPC12/RpoP